MLLRTFEGVGRAVPASARETQALNKRLVAAGYRSLSTAPLYRGIKCASALLLLLIFGGVALMVQGSGLSALLGALSAGAVGFLLPEHVLGLMIKARVRRIRRALPDALDLLVLCVEAGQSVDQALVDTSVEMKRVYPDLSAELALTHLELRTRTSRAEALRNLAGRNPEPELRKLVDLLIQSDRFGTSMAPALRTHAHYLRVRNRQQAEEAARKISVKLLFPIFFLIFPCMLLVTAGPAIIQVFTQLLPMINGK
ncbi:MAG TPA: type II secretion system F family protein [Terriglobales bacterium]|nr:type II secretion system F family protein [Terriglobales bacterium]